MSHEFGSDDLENIYELINLLIQGNGGKGIDKEFIRSHFQGCNS